MIQVGFIREWEGDISDEGHLLFVQEASDKDANPNWVPVYTKSENPVVDVINLLKDLKDDERLDVFRAFCTHCGSQDPRCSCWNDE